MEWRIGRGRTAMLAAILLTLACAAPLFIGLDRWDLENDESIYSYAALRMLETRDWLTPRAIPTDYPLLEKPPLKYWLVGGAMAAGLTPANEFGLRIFDAAFGAVAFAYVMAFGWRLGGLLCGGVALLVLVSIDPLLFQHGLRTNNMEAALFLSYCGGLYHGYRWFDCAHPPMRRRHALAVAAFATLGFMTKFVAVVFLPMSFVAWVCLRPSVMARLRATWTDWILPAVASAIVVLPWFVYQALTNDAFWDVLFTQHVVTRMTSSLDPAHLEPWYFYFVRTWRELDHGDSLLLALAGLATLGWRAWRRDALPQLLLIWWGLPFLLISLGTSKLVHYAYPFLPPLALGAGFACVAAVRALHGRLGSRMAAPLAEDPVLSAAIRRPWLRAVLVACGLAALALAVWTFVAGPRVTLTLGGTDLLRNSSVLRPLLLGGLLLMFAGYPRTTTGAVLVGGLLLFVPMEKYEERARYTSSIEHPLRAARDCMLAVAASGRSPAAGVYVPDPVRLTHPYYFYFRGTGPWAAGTADWPREVEARLSAGTPVILTADQWDLVRGRPDEQVRAALAGVAGVWVDTEVALLLPGAYAGCRSDIMAASAFAHTRGLPPS